MPDNRTNPSRSFHLFPQLTDQWVRASEHALNSSVNLVESAIEANRTFTATFGGSTPSDGDGKAAAPIAETEYKDPQWSFDRSVDTFEKTWRR